MKRKKVYLYVLFLILMAGLLSCAPANGSGTQPPAVIEPATEVATEPPAIEQPTSPGDTITFWSWAEYDFENQALIKMVDAYNAANPDTKVELNVIRGQ